MFRVCSSPNREWNGDGKTVDADGLRCCSLQRACRALVASLFRSFFLCVRHVRRPVRCSVERLSKSRARRRRGQRRLPPIDKGNSKANFTQRACWSRCRLGLALLGSARPRLAESWLRREINAKAFENLRKHTPPTMRASELLIVRVDDFNNPELFVTPNVCLFSP